MSGARRLVPRPAARGDLPGLLLVLLASVVFLPAALAATTDRVQVGRPGRNATAGSRWLWSRTRSVATWGSRSRARSGLGIWRTRSTRTRRSPSPTPSCGSSARSGPRLQRRCAESSSTRASSSAIITPSGPPAEIVRAIRLGRIALVVSPHLLAELLGVLRREKFRQYVGIDESRQIFGQPCGIWRRKAAGVGFEPTAPGGATVFKTLANMPVYRVFSAPFASAFASVRDERRLGSPAGEDPARARPAHGCRDVARDQVDPGSDQPIRISSKFVRC